MKAKKKIIIVGGGISGLAAARELGRHLDVTLLEARDRLGGRILTDHSWPAPQELGAQVVHGFTDNPVGSIARGLSLKVKPSDYTDVRLFKGRSPLPMAQLKKYEKEFDACMRSIPDYVSPFKKDTSILLPLKRKAGSRIPKDIFNWIMDSQVIFSGADFEEQSARYYEQDNDCPGPNVFFEKGFDQVLKVFKKLPGVKVRLNQHVTEISLTDKGAAVTANGKTLRADYVLVTLPLGVLQSGKVKFRPRLPAWKQEAIARMGMGVLNAVYLQFDRVFWPEGHSFIGMTEGTFSRFTDKFHLQKVPVLAGLIGGSAARRLEKLTDAEITRKAMKQLRKVFGPSIPDPIRVRAMRWSSDPFALGSYSHIPVGSSPADSALLAEPLRDRIFFAGEATNKDHPGTVHGAYFSGTREAARILRAARSSVLS